MAQITMITVICFILDHFEICKIEVFVDNSLSPFNFANVWREHWHVVAWLWRVEQGLYTCSASINSIFVVWTCRVVRDTSGHLWYFWPCGTFRVIRDISCHAEHVESCETFRVMRTCQVLGTLRVPASAVRDPFLNRHHHWWFSRNSAWEKSQ